MAYIYYRPYKLVSTNTQKRVNTAQGQYAGTKRSKRARSSKTIGQGVAESYSKTQYIQELGTWEYKYIIYLKHQRTNILTY